MLVTNAALHDFRYFDHMREGDRGEMNNVMRRISMDKRYRDLHIEERRVINRRDLVTSVELNDRNSVVKSSLSGAGSKARFARRERASDLQLFFRHIRSTLLTKCDVTNFA